MDTSPLGFYNEFLRISEAGDEAAARTFLSEHLAEFPEETRDAILFASLEEALLNRADAIKENATLQQEGLDAFTQLKNAKSEFEREARIDELKSNLGVQE